MTLTKIKKRKLKLSKQKIIEFKKENGITKCQWCGHNIENSPHHYLCLVCWDIRKKTTKHNMAKARKLRQIQANKIGREHITI